MNISKILRLARQQKKMTQMEVARRSQISLATIQNIEADRANPEWDTLSALFKTLQLKIEFHNSPLDWSKLATLGCPILVDTKNHSANVTELKETLISLDLSQHSEEFEERQLQALVAWLSALRDHYPSLWKLAPSATKKWLTETTTPLSIKLRRSALSQLGSYL